MDPNGHATVGQEVQGTDILATQPIPKERAGVWLQHSPAGDALPAPTLGGLSPSLHTNIAPGAQKTPSPRANCHKTNLEGFRNIQNIGWEEVQPCPPPGSLRAGALPSPGCDLLLTGTGCVNRL